MPISRTQQPGMVGTMPPRATTPPPATSGLKIQAAALTKKQLIALCELRGVEVSHHQVKAYYVQKLRLAGHDTPPTEDELDRLE